MCYIKSGTLREEGRELIADLSRSISEMLVRPEVGVKEEDVDRASCSRDVTTSDYSALHRAVLLQRILLDELFIAAWVIRI